MSSKQTILVVGSTGQQGGGVVSAILTSPLGVNATVRALTRNPSGGSAQRLQRQGAKPVKGDMLDKDSLTEAMRGVDGAFLVTDFNGPKGIEGEVEQGKMFVDVAKSVGVKHIVFSSVGSADIAKQVPHFHSKLRVEEYLKQSGLQWTILRPVAFMDNIQLTGFKRFMSLGLFGSTLGFGRKADFVAVEDIGKVAAQCLLSPEKYQKRTIQLAGDCVTTSGIQSLFKKVTGVKPWALWVPGWFMLSLIPYDLRQMFKFIYKTGYNTDVAALRAEFPELLTFEDWIRKQTAKIKHS